MRFMTRGVVGLLLGLLSVALLVVAAQVVLRALEEGRTAQGGRGAAAERLYAVTVARLEPATVAPVVTAYGEVASARTLEIRAGIGGRLSTLAEGFREGGEVAAGDLLYEIDPGDARAARETAAVDLADATAELAEAEAAIDLVRADREAAEAQIELREAATARLRDLAARGIGAAPERETAEIALSQARQTLVGRRQAEAQAEARIARARIALDRAGIALAEADRRLGETRGEAAFSGVLSDVTARPGALVAQNELLGTLVDPSALEVAFRVPAADFARLVDAGGRLLPLPVRVELAQGALALTAEGRLERVAATAGAGQAGRLLFAALEPGAPVRPGDFVTVRLEEPALASVARIPARAIDLDGRILVLGPEDRLAEAPVRVLRREGDSVIVADAPWGASFVTARAPQLAPGIRVRPLEADEDPAILLDPAHRAALVAALEADPRLPPALRAELLDGLAADSVPRSLLDRIDTATGG